MVDIFPSPALYISWIELFAIFDKAFFVAKFFPFDGIRIKIVIHQNGIYLIIACYFCNHLHQMGNHFRISRVQKIFSVKLFDILGIPGSKTIGIEWVVTQVSDAERIEPGV